MGHHITRIGIHVIAYAGRYRMASVITQRTAPRMAHSKPWLLSSILLYACQSGRLQPQAQRTAVPYAVGDMEASGLPCQDVEKMASSSGLPLRGDGAYSALVSSR